MNNISSFLRCSGKPCLYLSLSSCAHYLSKKWL